MNPAQNETRLGYIDVVGVDGIAFVRIRVRPFADSTRGPSAELATAPTEIPGWSPSTVTALTLLHEASLPLDSIHWNAWLLYRHLTPYHVTDDWFDVRHLVDDSDWESFLEAALDDTLPGTDCPTDGAADLSIRAADPPSRRTPAALRATVEPWAAAGIFEQLDGDFKQLQADFEERQAAAAEAERRQIPDSVSVALPPVEPLPHPRRSLLSWLRDLF